MRGESFAVFKSVVSYLDLPTVEMEKKIYYSEYLQLDKILNAQQPESALAGVRADDEMLFIIIHQSYELWFKQLMHELNIIREVFAKPEISDHSNDLSVAVHRLNRMCRIMNMLVNKMEILETMTSMDFFDFRDFLRPASGFQSIQFKMFEAALGLEYGQRVGQEYYISQLHEADVKRVKSAEAEVSLFVFIQNWLERFPMMADPSWKADAESSHPFWIAYRNIYQASLHESEIQNMSRFDALFMQDQAPEGRRLSGKASRTALFIMMYQDYPLMQLPFQLISLLLDLDAQLAAWRNRHLNMVKRMIGTRSGTGGSTGAGYLRSAADSHYIFKDFAELTSYLVQRQKLPALPPEIKKYISFENI